MDNQLDPMMKDQPAVDATPAPVVEQLAAAAPRYFPIIKKKLTEKQEEKAVALIKKEMEKTLETYEEFNNGEGWFAHIDRTTQDYENGKDVEDIESDVEKKSLLWTTMMCDIVASKSKRQTCGPSPLFLLIPKKISATNPPKKWDANEIIARQDRLDYIMRTDGAIEELNYVADRMACANGVSIIKYPYEKNTEYKTRKTVYSKANIAEFESIYASDMANTKSKAYKNWQKIQAGQEVEITDVEPIVQFNGVKPYRVNLKKFFARLDVKDFRRHKVISEMIDTYSWADIEAKTEQDDDEEDPYKYDRDAVNRLKDKLNGENSSGTKHLESKNTIYESIVYIKFDSEVAEGEEKPKDRYQRYCLTYEDQFKIVLKCIYYPYEHNDIYYTAKTAIPRDDSWAGYSFSTRLKDGKAFAESLLNSMVNQFQLNENLILLTDDDSRDFSRIPLTNDDGISVIKVAAGKKLSQVNWSFPNVDRPGLMNWGFNGAALTTGVDPAVNSGAQTPDDPRAPLGKAQLKQANSDKRIEDIILNLQKADELGARMTDWTYMQFVDEDKKEFFDGDYVAHGSTLSFNPENDTQEMVAVWGFTKEVAPQVAQDTNAIYTVLNAIYNNAGGSIKKNKDVILKVLKDQLDLQEATAQIIQHVTETARAQGVDGNVIQQLQAFVVKALQSGRKEEEIYAVIPQVIEAIKAQPAGMPGQPVVPGQPGAGQPVVPGQPPAPPGPPTEVIQ